MLFHLITSMSDLLWSGCVIQVGVTSLQSWRSALSDIQRRSLEFKALNETTHRIGYLHLPNGRRSVKMQYRACELTYERWLLRIRSNQWWSIPGARYIQTFSLFFILPIHTHPLIQFHARLQYQRWRPRYLSILRIKILSPCRYLHCRTHLDTLCRGEWDGISC
jgi:hypothetical protein